MHVLEVTLLTSIKLAEGTSMQLLLLPLLSSLLLENGLVL